MDIERALHKLRVKYFAPLKRGFDGFWSWWTDELIALLPQNLREAVAQRKQRLFVELQGEDVVVRQGTTVQEREIMRTSLNAAEVAQVELPQDVRDTVLLMPEDKVLTRSLSLPLAAEENLREVLAFEMDRQTPFSVDQVYYDVYVTERASARQSMSLDLVYAPRTAVDQLIDAVSRVGIHPDVVTCRNGAAEELRGVNLLPESRRQSRRIIRRRVNATLASLAVVLFITAVSLPLVQKAKVIRLLEPQLKEAVADATEGNQLRQDIEKLADGSRFLVQKKQSNLLVVQVINEVSRILPDQTWLNRLDIAGDEIQLQGQSSSAAALIALIEESPMLHNARFRSPVIQIPQTDEERFHLSADVIWDQIQ